MVEKTKTVRGGKWTEDPPIHFGWLAAALLPSRTSGKDLRPRALSYGLRMKISAGSLNRELSLRTCSSVSFRCPARNIEKTLSDPNSSAGGPAWTERLPVRFEWLAAA